MNFGNNGIIWIIVLLLLCGCGNNGIGNIFGGCGNDCTWLIIIVLILCCGNGMNICDNKC